MQNIRLCSALLALENKILKLTPPPTAFEVSDALQVRVVVAILEQVLTVYLQKNLQSYAQGVIFSSKIPNYKGTVPINHLLVSRYSSGLLTRLVV